jgi:hypothetical protein
VNTSAAATGKPYAYVGVFDGHGGSASAEWLEKNLYPLIEEEWPQDSPDRAVRLSTIRPPLPTCHAYSPPLGASLCPWLPRAEGEQREGGSQVRKAFIAADKALLAPAGAMISVPPSSYTSYNAKRPTLSSLRCES